MNKSFATLGLAAIMASASSAHAAPTTFFFDSGDKGQTSLTKAVDGITLTLSSFSTGPRSGADSDGLVVYCGAAGTIIPCEHNNEFEPYTSYQMTFDKSVQILNYNISYSGNASDSVTTYSQGSSVSAQLNTSSGLTSFVNPFIAAANSPILVSTVDLDNDGLLQINAFTVEMQTAPPASVPGPLPLAGAATAFSLSRELRRRMRRAVGV
jgi:hypothetical protein